MAGRTGDFVIKIELSESFCLKPIITLHTTKVQIDLTEQSRLIANCLNRALLYKNVFLLLKATRQRSDVSATSWRHYQGIEIKMVWGPSSGLR